MSFSLYDIAEADRKLQELIANVETDDDNEHAIALMEEIEGQLVSKGAGIIKAKMNVKGMVNALDIEIKRLTAMKKAIEGKDEKFNKYIKMCMIKMDTTKIETPLGTLSLAKGRESTVIDNPDVVPKKFKTVVKETKIDKMAIKQAINAGEKVKGARVVRGEPSLTIK